MAIVLSEVEFNVTPTLHISSMVQKFKERIYWHLLFYSTQICFSPSLVDVRTQDAFALLFTRFIVFSESNKEHV